ncbi:MAG: VWA domain-containing protein [Planctomycetota bacterium]
MFENPSALYWLWGLVPLLLLLLHARGRRARAAARLLEAPMRGRLLPASSGLRTFLPMALLLLSFASLILAMSRPRFGVFYEKVSQRGADLVVLLDVSRSMLSDDVHPNRLERSKSYIRDLLARVRGDRVGLVVFAGKAAQACPLTTDHAFLLRVLAEVGPHSAPRGGTVIGDAIREATNSLDTQPDRDQAFLLITDGEDQDSFPLEAAAVAAAQGVKIFTVGIGDPDQGARIPLPQNQGEESPQGYVKQDGQEIWSRMDEELLKKIALESGGAYVPARTGTYDLGQVYTEHLADLRAGALQDKERRRYREQFQLFAALGLALFLMSMLVSRYRRAAVRTALGLALLSAVSLDARANAAEDGIELHNKGVAELRDGRIGEALELFQKAAELAPGQPRISLGRGAALQQKGDLDEAREQYLDASSKGDKLATAVARYNLGTLAVERARAALGDVPEEAQGEDRTKALEEIAQAVDHFRATLRLEPDHTDARHNLELLRLWTKHIQDAWKKRDEKQENQEKDLLALLMERMETQQKLRVDLRGQLPEASSPKRDEALAVIGEGQRELAGQIEPLRPKVEETFAQLEQAAAQAPQGQGGQSPEEMEQAKQQVLMLLASIEADMMKAADALENALADAAAPAQKSAHDKLEALWRGFANFPQLLNQAVALEESLVQRTAPLAEALPGAAPPGPADMLEREALVEEQGRVGALVPNMLNHAEGSVPHIQGMLEQQPDMAELKEEEKASLEEQKKRLEAELAAFEKALENLPLIPELSQAAVELLDDGEPVGALSKEEEILRLLREIAELWPHDPNQDQGQPNEDQQGEQQQDEKQEQDQKDQQQEQKEQQEQNQEEPLTKEQIEKMLQQALDREKEYKEKKKELQRLLVVPVPVEKDW